MSEFTDFHALLTEAETLGALRGALVRAVGGAYVPLNEIDVDFDGGIEATEAVWAKTRKPIWLKLGIAGTIDDLAKLGPAARIRVEEDFSSWGLDLRCGDVSFSGAFLTAPDRYREATDGMPIFNPAAQADTLAAAATCVGLTPDALSATFIADGGQSFAQAVGIIYEQMLDMTLEEIEPGEVILSDFY